MADWHLQSTSELLQAYAGIMRELRLRNVVRSTNNPVADLAEALAAHAFQLELAEGSTKGYDGMCTENRRWQVKARRLTPENPNTGLGVIRNHADGAFDYLIAIYFNEDFSVQAAYRLEHSAIATHGDWSNQQGGFVVRIKKALVEDPRCEDVTAAVRRAERAIFGRHRRTSFPRRQ